jgi:hypothetical protein
LLVLELDELGLDEEPAPALPEALPVAPPLASFFDMSVEDEEEPEAEPDGEDGVDGVVVEPEDDAEPDGDVGEVVVPRDAERSPPRSQPATSAVPSATDTATARTESLMWPPWLGYSIQAARFGPARMPKTTVVIFIQL